MSGLVLMQFLVEGDCFRLPLGCFDGTSDGVAAQQHAGCSGKLGCLHGGAFVNVSDFSDAAEDGNLRARGDVEAGFDNAVIAKRNAHAGVCTEQAALTDGNGLLAATGQGAHDGCATADIGAVANDDTCGNTSFNHGSTKGAGVEVYESFVHNGGAFCQVCTQAHAVCVTDANAGRNDVVHHAWELVHGEHRNWAAGCQAAAHHLEVCDCTWTVVGPDNVSQVAEDAVHVESVGLDCTVGKKVQTQISVICVDWRSVEVRNGSLNCDASYTALFVGEIGRASCRERVESAVVAVAVKKRGAMCRSRHCKD